MKRTYGFIVLAIVILFVCPLASAQAAGDAVGLGVSIGVAFPNGGTARIPNNGEASLNWGFYVNIPLIYTFHITPSSELYKLGTQNATDMDVSFNLVSNLDSFLQVKYKWIFEGSENLRVLHVTAGILFNFR
jgi:hypothetical protein